MDSESGNNPNENARGRDSDDVFEVAASKQFQEAVARDHQKYAPSDRVLEEVRQNIREKLKQPTRSVRFPVGRFIWPGLVMALALLAVGLWWLAPPKSQKPEAGEQLVMTLPGFMGRPEESSEIGRKKLNTAHINESVTLFSRGLKIRKSRRRNKQLVLDMGPGQGVVRFQGNELDRELHLRTDLARLVVKGTEFAFFYDGNTLAVLLREGRLWLENQLGGRQSLRAEPGILYFLSRENPVWKKRKFPRAGLFTRWKQKDQDIQGIVRRAEKTMGLRFDFQVETPAGKSKEPGKKPAVLFLKNGSRLVGEIKMRSQSHIILETSDKETIQIPVDEILRQK